MIFYNLLLKYYLKKINRSKLPTHVALIPDGNRRWARKKGLPPWEGHRKGAENLNRLIEFAFKLGIKYFTVFALSTENFKRRSRQELEFLFKLFKEYITKLLDKAIRNKIKVKFIGKIKELPRDLQEKIREVENKTKNYNERTLTICINYGGRADIVNAVNKIIKEEKHEVSEEEFKRYLWTKNLPEVDLLIRTGKEKRISNFLLWDLAYAELYFSDKYFPDFNEIDFLKAIIWYQKRERRFGR